MDLEAMKKRAQVGVFGRELSKHILALVAEVERLRAERQRWISDYTGAIDPSKILSALQVAERERDEAREMVEQLKVLLKGAIAEGGKQLEKIEAALAIKPVCKLPDCPCQRGMREALTGGRE